MPTPPRTDPKRLGVLAGVAVFAAHMARFADGRFTLDDAWISFRISRNLVTQGLLTYDVTRPPVEGMTNLLWTLLSTSWIALLPGVDPAIPARLLGGLCGAVAVALAGAVAADLAAREGASERAQALAAGVAAVVLGAAGNVAFYATSGLETGLQLLLWALCVRGILAARGPAAGLGLGRGLALGLGLVLLAAGRPEGVLGAALLLGIGLVLRGPRDRPLWTAGGVFIAGVAAMEAFRWGLYGSLVPNTFFAKPPDGTAGTAYLWAFLWPGLGLLGPLALIPALRSRAAQLLLAVAAVLIAGAAWSGGDWMPGFRRLLESAWILAVLAGFAAALAQGRMRVLVGVGVAAWLGGSAVMAVRGSDSGRYGHIVYGQVGALLARSPQVETVATIDIGRLGWYFPGSVFDLAGLTDARLAHAGGWDAEWFVERSPEVAVVVAGAPVGPDLADPPKLRRFEAPMLAWMRANGGYAPRAALPVPGGMVLTVLVRDGVEVPEEIWGAPPAPGEALRL
jgi:hypothetical protein